MKAVAALTYNGALLAEKICDCDEDADLFINERFTRDIELKCNPFKKISDMLKDNWSKYDSFILIMASGIVVRSIAPLLKNKNIDPAVLVIDEKGRNVISLLSGHMGGANELALKIADLLNANPVITTASDVNDLPAFDDIARKNNMIMQNGKRLYRIAADMLERKEIELFSTIDVAVDLPDNVKILKNANNFDSDVSKIIISEKRFDEIDVLKLIPKNIIIGIGCRKNISYENIEEAFSAALTKTGICKEAVSKIATIELKADEPGIKKLAENLGVGIEIVSTEKIKEIENDFTGSEFVKSVTGVKSVSEPTAFIAAADPEIILRKTALNGVTVSLVKDKSVKLEEI